jgi:hypothetical protein
MMEDQQRAIEPNSFDLDIGHRGRKHGTSVGFLADITNETLNDLSADAAVFDLGEIGFVAFFDLADEARM